MVVGGAFGGYVVYHKETVIRPLEIAEHDAVSKMSCDDLKVKHEKGQYWSFKNWKAANAKLCSCPGVECSGGH
ncbi:MAG: hypothetical protein EB167_00725 [Nitrososphaeria archaeon]|nr:hypothetical protein [Nitrososphaeria archaeon]